MCARMKRTCLLLLLVENLASGAVPVEDGLALCLDARDQTAARGHARLPPLVNSQPVDRWFDTSANARHALQPSASPRPAFRLDEREAFLHFDGKDDFMAVSGSLQPASNVTVFVLAAPRTNHGNFSALFLT